MNFVSWARVLVLAAAFLSISLSVACSSSSSSSPSGTTDGGAAAATGPAPAGTLSCTDGTAQSEKCSCVLASARTGACSPQTLGETAHCCATVDGSGSTTQCDCQADRKTNCCNNGASIGGCVCTVENACSEVNGVSNAADSCTAPSGGHCCMSAFECACTTNACDTTQTEVDSCAPQAVILACLAPAIAVTSCQ